MKIAVFTDVHGNFKALKTVLERIKKKNADRRVVCRTQGRSNHLVWQGGLVFGRKYSGIGVI